MKTRNLILAALIAGFTLPALAVESGEVPAAPAADAAQFMPPGPWGGPRWMTPEQREKLNTLTPEEWRKVVQERRADCPRGKARGPILTPEQRDKLRAMTPQERRAYMQEWLDQPAPTEPAAK